MSEIVDLLPIDHPESAVAAASSVRMTFADMSEHLAAADEVVKGMALNDQRRAFAMSYLGVLNNLNAGLDLHYDVGVREVPHVNYAELRAAGHSVDLTDIAPAPSNDQWVHEGRIAVDSLMTGLILEASAA